METKWSIVGWSNVGWSIGATKQALDGPVFTSAEDLWGQWQFARREILAKLLHLFFGYRSGRTDEQKSPASNDPLLHKTSKEIHLLDFARSVRMD